MFTNIKKLIKYKSTAKITKYYQHVKKLESRKSQDKQLKLMYLLEKYNREDCIDIFIACFASYPMVSYTFKHNSFFTTEYKHDYILYLLNHDKFTFVVALLNNYIISLNGLADLFGYFIATKNVQFLDVYMKTQKLDPSVRFTNTMEHSYPYLRDIQYDLLTYSIASQSIPIFSYFLKNYASACDLEKIIFVKCGAYTLKDFIYIINNPKLIELLFSSF